MVVSPQWGVLNLQEGMRINIELLNYFHDYIMVFLVLIIWFVSYVFLYSIFSSYSDKVSMDSHFLESVWTITPIFILLFIAFPSMFLLYLLEELSFPRISVKVSGHQWYWEYQYFNFGISYSFDSYMIQDSSRVFHNLDVDSRLILPLLADVLFLVTSSDVLHSWTVPRIGIKVDAIPGRLNYLISSSINCGVYYGQCREICGANHRFMPIVVECVPIDFFVIFLSSLE